MAATAARVRCVACGRSMARRGGPATYAAELVAHLQAAGDTCVVVSSAQALGGVVADVLASEPPITGCVHLASVEVDPDASPTEPGAADNGWASALALVQALVVRASDDAPPRLWLVTRGAQRMSPDHRSVSLGAAAEWGFGAAIGYEHPALHTTRVDLPVASRRDGHGRARRGAPRGGHRGPGRTAGNHPIRGAPGPSSATDAPSSGTARRWSRPRARTS